MNSENLKKHIHDFWDSEIVPTLVDYIKIPNKSPSFDPDWEKHGHMDKVLNLAANWTEKNKPIGSEMIIKKSPGRTPLLLLDIPGTKKGNILMYGHLDKQPDEEIVNEAEDTLTILTRFVDNLNFDGDNAQLNTLIRELYNEASSVEV
ncbi:MAG: hypothetical protein EBR72_09855 [Bacteroidetes bacterium]|nr:hypothetical protein [Bacteroidota bacterium]